ncbi:unnamed protein product [Calypogeia fissa]
MVLEENIAVHVPSVGEEGNGISGHTEDSMANGDSVPVVAKKANGYAVSAAVPAQQADSGVRIVDLRSDTMTMPTPAMRAAMAAAPVGDDVVGEDPTANELQASAAKLFCKDAALFVPSGTMGNLIAVLVHCEMRGSEVILGSECHIVNYEQGGIATLGGVYPKVIKNNADGTIDLSELEAAVQPSDVHFAITRLICLENTHNRCGGRVLTAEYTDKVGELAKRHGIKLHIDGARIFNAATALGVSVARLVRSADSVSVCLSKGLGAPVGSVLVGSHEFIAKATRMRKALGGGMRQIGVLCASGLISLRDMSKRLQEDHRAARSLAEGLNKIAALQVDVEAVESNIIFVKVSSQSPLRAGEICASLNGVGIRCWPFENNSIRLVTSYQVTQDDVQHAISCFEKLLLRVAV